MELLGNLITREYARNVRFRSIGRMDRMTMVRLPMWVISRTSRAWGGERAPHRRGGL